VTLPLDMEEPCVEHDLPDGWRWARLGDLCMQDRRVVSPNMPQADRLPYLSLEHIESQTGRVLRKPTEGSEDVGTSTTFAFDSRHVLYGKLRPYLNKVALPTFAGRCTTELIPLLPRGTNREFLAWLLRRPQTVDVAMRGRTGSRMPRADMGNLFASTVPVPPLDEQRGIAEALTDQMAAVDRMRAVAEARLAVTEGLSASCLRAVFDCEEAGRWPKRCLGDLLRIPLRMGISKPYAEHSEWRCLTLSSVRGGLLDLDVAKPVAVTDREAEGSLVQPGAFYVVRGNGNRSLVGRGALAPPVLRTPILYPDLLIQVDVDPSSLLPAFLRWAWDSADVRKQLEAAARTSAGIYKVNQAILSNTLLPVPSLDEQARLATIVDGHISEARRLRDLAANHVVAISAVPTVLLRDAFTGRL